MFKLIQLIYMNSASIKKLSLDWRSFGLSPEFAFDPRFDLGVFSLFRHHYLYLERKRVDF